MYVVNNFPHTMYMGNPDEPGLFHMGHWEDFPCGRAEPFTALDRKILEIMCIDEPGRPDVSGL